MTETWLNKFHCARKNSVTFGNTVGKTSHAENQKITGLARQEVLRPVQRLRDMGDRTARLPA